MKGLIKGQQWYVDVESQRVVCDDDSIAILKRGEIVVVDDIDTVMCLVYLCGKNSTFGYTISFDDFLNNFEILPATTSSLEEKLLKHALAYEIELRKAYNNMQNIENPNESLELKKGRMLGILDCLDLAGIDRNQFNWVFIIDIKNE